MPKYRNNIEEEQEDQDIIEVVKSYSPGKARLYSKHPKDDEDETHLPKIKIHSAVVPPDKPIEKDHAEGS